jgi:hypothetical protein
VILRSEVVGCHALSPRQTVFRKNLRNSANARFEGFGCLGHSKGESACQSPVSLYPGMYWPVGSAKSAIVMTCSQWSTIRSCVRCFAVVFTDKKRSISE